MGAFPMPPKFTSKEQEREYLKFRLAQAFRIFGQMSRLYLAPLLRSEFDIVAVRYRQARLRRGRGGPYYRPGKQ